MKVFLIFFLIFHLLQERFNHHFCINTLDYLNKIESKIQ